MTLKLLLPGILAGRAQARITAADRDLIGYLLTPKKTLKANLEILATFDYACDNECYTLGERFDFIRYLRFLERIADYPGKCLFATVPDAVGDAAATAERWRAYAPEMARTGLPLAYVLQDGCDSLPAGDYAAIFIGGSTEYKLGQTVARIVSDALARGLWPHMGRANTIRRFTHAIKIGCKSVDGTAWVKQPGRHIRWALPALRRLAAQLPMEGLL